MLSAYIMNSDHNCGWKPAYIHHIQRSSIMGKSRHHTLHPRIRHVRYSVQATSRGPKTVKRQVDSSPFLSTKFESNQTSATDFPPPMENNGTMDDWFQQTGKVQLIQYYYVFALMIELIESKWLSPWFFAKEGRICVQNHRQRSTNDHNQ